MVKQIYRGNGMTQLVYEENCVDREKELKTIRLYAKDLLAEIRLIAVTAMFIFGFIFAVPMVRHEAFYIVYWILTFAMFVRILYLRYRKQAKKKSRNRARSTAQRR